MNKFDRIFAPIALGLIALAWGFWLGARLPQPMPTDQVAQIIQQETAQ